MEFYTKDLLSKNGFNDGDQMYDFVSELVRNRVIPDGMLIGRVYYFDVHQLLYNIIKTHVVPKIVSHKVILKPMLSTQHNPVRAMTINGEIEPDDGWNDILLSSPSIVVEDYVIALEAIRLYKQVKWELEYYADANNPRSFKRS